MPMSNSVNINISKIDMQESPLAEATSAPHGTIDDKQEEVDIDDEEEEECSLLPPFVEQVTTIIPTKSAKEWNDTAIQECFQLSLKSFVSRDKNTVDNGDNITCLFNPGEIKYEEDDTMDVDEGNNSTMIIDNQNGDDKNQWKPSELAPPLWALIHPGNQINNNEKKDNPKSVDGLDAT